MPAGLGIVCRQEPQVYCPDCELDGVVAALNRDKFPHLQV